MRLLASLSNAMRLIAYYISMDCLFYQRIKELRVEKSLRQEDLAKQLNVSRAFVCDWECNRKRPCYEILMNIAKFFEVTTDYLLGLTEY